VKQLTPHLASALPKAAEVFAENGLDATTIEQVVLATGIPKPTLYYHFSSKEEIVTWLLERFLADLSARVEAVVEQDLPPADRLRLLLASHLEMFAEQPHVCTVLLSELGRVLRIPVVSTSVHQAFHEPVAALLVEVQRDGALIVLDPEVASSAIFGMVAMVGLRYVTSGVEMPTESVLRQLEALLRLPEREQ